MSPFAAPLAIALHAPLGAQPAPDQVALPPVRWPTTAAEVPVAYVVSLPAAPRTTITSAVCGPDDGLLVAIGDEGIRRFKEPGSIDPGFAPDFGALGGVSFNDAAKGLWLLDTRERAVEWWAFDGARSTSRIEARIPGALSEAVALSDGSLVVNGPGATEESIGKILHHLKSGTWSSHVSDSKAGRFFTSENTWSRQMAATQSDTMIALVHPRNGSIQVVSPSDGFRVTRLLRRDDEWIDESADWSGPPPPGVTDIRFGAEQLLWILWNTADSNWREGIRPDAAGSSGIGYSVVDRDLWLDSVIEIWDIEEAQLRSVIRLDVQARWLMAGGVLARQKDHEGSVNLEFFGVPGFNEFSGPSSSGRWPCNTSVDRSIDANPSVL